MPAKGQFGGRNRPPHFDEPEEFMEAWQEYKEVYEAKGDWINKEHFCRAYGFYLDIFVEYKKKPKFTKTIEAIEADCKQHLIQKGLKNEYNSTIVKLVASCNYGMTEKQDIIQQNHNISETYSEYKKRLKTERDKAKKAKAPDSNNDSNSDK